MKIYFKDDRKRCCCNCANYCPNGNGSGVAVCGIDGHHIGYIECFCGWCRQWKKEEK